MKLGNIEGGGLGGSGVAVSVGPSLNFGPSLGGVIGPSMPRFGSLASLGPELKAPSPSTFLSDGLVKGGLENTMSIYTPNNISPNKDVIEPIFQADLIPTDPFAEIAEVASQPSSLISVIESFLSEARLNKPKPVLIEEEAVSEAEHILGLDKLDKPEVSGLQSPSITAAPELQPFRVGSEDEELLQPSVAESSRGGIVNPDLPKLEAVRNRISLLKVDQNTAVTSVAVAPALEVAPKLENVLATKSQVSSKTNQVEQAPVAEEQLREQIEVEEQVPTENLENNVQEHEEVSKTIALHVIDRAVVVKRIKHIVGVGAVVFGKAKAILETKGQQVKVKGSEVTKFLLPSNKGEIRGGEINTKDPEEKLPDKTWDATLQRIEELEFTSEDELSQQVPTIVEINHPVEVATRGQIASPRNVIISHDHSNGGNHGVIEFEKRKKLKIEQVVKNGQQQALVILSEAQEKGNQTERNIHDHFPLAQALKAA